MHKYLIDCGISPHDEDECASTACYAMGWPFTIPATEVWRRSKKKKKKSYLKEMPDYSGGLEVAAEGKKKRSGRYFSCPETLIPYII